MEGTVSISPNVQSDSIDSYLTLIARSKGNRKCSIMDDLTLLPETARRLAEHVEAYRPKVVASVLQSNGNSRSGSLAASIFMNSLLDRFALECETRDRSGLDAWVSEFGSADPGLDYDNLILLTFGALSASFVANEGPSSEIVRHLVVRGSALERIVSQTRFTRRQEQLPDPTQLVAKEDLKVSLLAALEAHDPAAAEHSRAVGSWCKRIAEALGMNDEGVEFIALCGTLHDVGKMATPTHILLKPGPLTNDEWEIMRAHSERGAQILEQVPSLHELSAVVRSHHERFDGLGYPDRLKGNEIPLAARIVAVADSFNAMISKRPYRTGMMSVTQAIYALMEGRGTQWDPKIVDVMITVVKPHTVVVQEPKRISDAM